MILSLPSNIKRRDFALLIRSFSGQTKSRKARVGETHRVEVNRRKKK